MAGQTEFRAFVRYKQITSRVELRKQFELRKHFDSVNEAYDDKNWQQHPSCQGIDRTPREVFFVVRKVAKSYWDVAPEIQHALNEGCRPSVLEETIAFAAIEPNLQRDCSIVAPGLFLMNPDGCWVPNLGGDLECRSLGICQADNCFPSEYILLVRKEA